nr:trimethylamine methyltransferase family protein [Pseudorhodobacter ferrugineus]
MNDQKPARSGRQAQRATRGGGMGRPYIIRNIPNYDVMSEENLLKTEATADRILAEVGIEFRDDDIALNHWKTAGAYVDGLLVKSPPRHVARNPEIRARAIHPTRPQPR